MLICLVLSVEEKQGIIEVTEKRERAATTTLLDPWQQALTRGRFEATRWCLPKSQVHKRLTKILRLNISQQDHKEQLSLPRSSATKSTGSSSWTTSRAVALMIYCWAVSLTTTSSWGRHRRLSRHLKQTLQKCHPKPQMSSSWCQKRRSHKSHHSPSSASLWTSLQNKCRPDVKLFQKRGKRVLTHFRPKPPSSDWNTVS